MKSFRKVILILVIIISFDPGPIFALEENDSASAPEQGTEELTDETSALSDAPAEGLYLYAINAGYKDASVESSQNYDFIALRLLGLESISLNGYRIEYTNSVGNFGGEVSFSSDAILSRQILVLGSKYSPQYASSPETYLYDFGSSGLASTGGKLALYRGEDLVDELCWGKIQCENRLNKFSSSEDENRMAVWREGGYEYESGGLEIDPEAITLYQVPDTNICSDIEFSEIYTYFEESSSEQFLELVSHEDRDCDLGSMKLVYKNKKHTLSGVISPGEHKILQFDDLVFTKNPNTQNEFIISHIDGTLIASANYYNGQKQGVSYARFSDGWKLTYARTPGEANVFQEFRSCPEGKVINESTGNCINATTDDEATVCPEGKYLNPETGRCKKIEEEELLTECSEGYERNPETNRCRKIVENSGMEYAPKTSATTSYDAPRRFVAYGALIIVVVSGLSYIVFQYREEIGRILRTMRGKTARLLKIVPIKQRKTALN